MKFDWRYLYLNLAHRAVHFEKSHNMFLSKRLPSNRLYCKGIIHTQIRLKKLKLRIPLLNSMEMKCIGNS